MVRRAINLLSPVAALALVWVSLQAFAIGTGEAVPPPTGTVGATANSAVSQVLPELGSVSQILATSSNEALGETVPATIKRILITNGTVLLVPEYSERAGGL